jgi:hypothetical protein
MTDPKSKPVPSPYEDEVLRRMLSTPPKPDKAKETAPAKKKSVGKAP